MFRKLLNSFLKGIKENRELLNNILVDTNGETSDKSAGINGITAVVIKAGEELSS